MSETLGIHLDTAHPMALYAAAELTRAWRRVEGGRVALDTPFRAATGPRVRLALGSVVRPSVIVRFEQPYEEKAAKAADVLGLTIAAWDAIGEREAWRELSGPLDHLPHVGAPSRSAPWAVTLPASGRVAPAEDSQLHIIGGLRPPSRGAVWWPRMARVAAAVLGRASVVLGEDDPLVYDAIRAGVPTERDDRARDEPAIPTGTLAGLVPPSLVGAAQLWDHVADTAREVHRTGATPDPLMTPLWVARGRDRIRDHRAAPPSSLEHLRRRYHKLQRDPQRFFADSKHGVLRAVGKVAFRR